MTNVQKLRAHLSTLGNETFRVRDLPKISCVHTILKTMELNGEVLRLAYDKGHVYKVGKLIGGDAPEEFTKPSPHPYEPYLPGYRILAKHVFAHGMGV